MPVYVDDMYEAEIGKFGPMKMSHLIADTDDELFAMVDAIGVQRKWFQAPGLPGRHFDIAISKRTEALRLGAVAITMKQCSAMVARRRVTGQLGSPEDAVQWLRDSRMPNRDLFY